ncbi:DnaD domain protein [uncultured Vagococcus sp.]|uniref:replication initiation and membrane attachment family protein n=1 Tax=uncultured Vagococcus sp. TaxID=189676 RepID=UPI0028D25C7D|nr:DnaD domain protein [uncultured Vagococcus sp.]
MNSSWKQLHPQDSFTVKLAAPITSHDEQLLSYLYQPIIGMDAFSIYHTFLTAVDESDYDSHELRHSDLFNQLNIDLPRLFNARVKLEGIGLLRVFVKEAGGRRHFIYELQAPLKAEELFQDDVLAVLLLDSVGDRRYQKLVQRFAIPKVNTTEYADVTKKFLDVYQFNQESIASHEVTLSVAKDEFFSSEKPKLSSVNETFDWAYFVSLLDGLYIDKEQIQQELKETVFTLHQLYGINELEMKSLVENEVDYVTNKVALNQLRKSVVLKYHGVKKQKTMPVEEAAVELSADDQLVRRRNTLKLLGYNDGEIQVIVSSESISPMIFLSAIKKQKGGFVANEERWAVENLVKQSGLPDSVINVLIHYILVGKGNAAVNQKFANSIANDWAQAQIFSPEDAMTKVKEMGAAAQKQSAPRKNNYRKQTSGRKETLPDWVGKTNAETKVSQEEEDYFKEQLRKMREKGKEGES